MRLESSIQAQILRELKKLDGFAYKHPPYPAGMPDIHFIYNGISFFFEVKRSKKHKPTKLQKHRHKQLRKVGCIVKVVTSWGEVKDILSKYMS